ncbi:transcriptional regulator [Vallitalea longa]|uniref:Transcriptional regulator n=1 Tax=Vallitalea longa TaxID=2936439 RepID=A0A9W5Y7X8_9FIRM|nr:metalloregulator ArsR/SmtB family transcription factor [Vallitalea longa]GKX27561.1 transcriptional regulator [Vallitalea longa]
MVEIFKTLGDENRLRIISLLINNELCVCEIEVLLEMTQSNVSRHLSKLKNTGIITSSKKAQWVHYKLSKEFQEENRLLIKYLDSKFKTDKLFLNDMRRYDKYKELCFNCQLIADDKEKVLKLIRLEPENGQ